MAGSPGGKEVGRISIRVVPDTSLFRQELKAQLEAIEHGLKAKIDVEPDMDGFREKVKAATSGMDAKVKVDVDRSALDRLSSLGGAAGGAGGASRFAMPFVDNLALVAGVAAIAAPALALVSGALAAMPSIMAGVMVPIGAITLGLDGIKKAAEVLKDPLDGLKTALSATFESRLTPVFTQLGTMLPTLAGPLNTVANGLSDVAQSLVNTVTSAPGIEKIQQTISNIGTAISAAAPGVGRMTDGLLGLARGVTAKFPAVSEWLNKVGDSFSNWVNKVTSDGSLDRAMGNLGDTLKGVLDLVGDIAKQGFDWLQDPNFGKSMTDFVNSTKTLVNDIMPGLGGIFTQISGALSGIVPILDRIDKWKPPDWMGLDPKAANEQQNHGFGAFPGMKFKSPEEGGGSFIPWEESKSSFAVFTQAVSQGWDALMLSLQQKVQVAFATIGSIISASIPTIAAAFATIPQAVATSLAGISVAAQTAFSGVVAVVRGKVAEIIGAVTAMGSQITSAMSSAFQSAVSAAASGMAQIVGAVVSGGAQVVGEVSSWPGKIAGALASLASTGAEAGRALGQGLVNGITSMVGAAVAAATSLAAKVAAAAKGALGIHSPSQVFHDIGTNTTQGLVNGLAEGTPAVVAQAQAVADKITEAMNNGIAIDPKTSIDEINKAMDAIDLQSKQLKVDFNGIPKGPDTKAAREDNQGQRQQLQTLRDQLSLQKEQLNQSKPDKEDKTDSCGAAGAKEFGDQAKKLMDIGTGFAEANIGQFIQDLGGTGSGALPTAANAGVGWLTSTLGSLISGGFGGTTINVGSVDDAIAVQRNEQAKKALQYSRR